MDILFLGMIILLIATVIFYIIFVSFVYYWHEKMLTVIVVPLLYTFDFFAIGFFIVVLVALLVQGLPILMQAAQNGPTF